MNKTKFRAVILLILSVMIVLGVESCGRAKTKQDKFAKNYVSKNSVQKTLNQETPTIPSQKDNVKVSDSNSVIYQPSNTYTRENPFLPLVTERSGTKLAIQKDVDDKGKKPEHPTKEITLKLTAVLNNDTAFFNEDGLKKTVYVGNVIAEMKVLEIRNNEVILSKDNKKYTMATGDQIKVTISTSK